jgi:hypothetical protein
METKGLLNPEPIKLSKIKSKLLRPALTSHFQCQFNAPTDVRDYLATYRDYNYEFNDELIRLSCCEASLPGSSLQTNEINDDYTGVTERLAYRRQYDDRADFTFYVDHGDLGEDYNVIWLFEQWISYIANEQFATGIEDSNYNYRFRFPDGSNATRKSGKAGKPGYRASPLFLTKFERDFRGSCLTYRFFDAYPISINSIPVSYESSELLKCTVSFTYTRYIVTRDLMPQIPDDPLGPVGSSSNSRIIGESQTGPNTIEYQLAPTPGQFTVPPGQGGAADLLDGLGGIGIRNPTVF